MPHGKLVSFARSTAKFYDQVLGFHVEDIEDGLIERFIVVWTIDGETTERTLSKPGWRIGAGQGVVEQIWV